MTDIANAAFGLIIGLLSGFFFERRATNLALAQNEELERELAILRHSILSVGGSLPVSRDVVDTPQLLDEVKRRAFAVQTSEGRVSRSALVSYLLAQGHAALEIEETIRTWCESDEVTEDAKWLILR